jgi:hypothetical protein
LAAVVSGGSDSNKYVCGRLSRLAEIVQAPAHAAQQPDAFWDAARAE